MRSLWGLRLALWLALSGCGGELATDQESTGGAGEAGGANGSSMGSGGTGGDPVGVGGLPSSCSPDRVECPGGIVLEPTCDCEGYFSACPEENVFCEVGSGGEEDSCSCLPDPARTGPEACDYVLQHRCEFGRADPWYTRCVCDPALPTDPEPCRYHQQMVDERGIEATCSISCDPADPRSDQACECICE